MTKPAHDLSKDIGPVRLRAMMERPYFAVAFCALVPIVRRGLGTFAVDQYARLYWDPEIIGQWGVERSAWVLIHELGHWIRDHHARAEPYLKYAKDREDEYRISRVINLCEDAEINDDLVREGAKLPPMEDESGKALPSLQGVPQGGIQPQHLGCEPGKMWEQYYEELRKRFESSGGVAPGKGGIPAPKGWDCGSAAHGSPCEWEEPAPGGAGSKGTESPGVNRAEGELIRREVARQVLQECARDPGSVAAGDRIWAEKYLSPPQVPWERTLAALIKNAMQMARGCVDYSYTKPNRRGAFQGVLMPALVRPVPHAAIVLDTSGSMCEAELHAAVSETEGVIKACGQRAIPVVCCDAAAYSPQRVTRALQIEIIGGGGTDMGVGLEHASKLGADVLIVLTDGFTPWPDKPPRRAQVVVGIVGNDAARKEREQNWPVPPWVKRVVEIRARSEGE